MVEWAGSFTERSCCAASSLTAWNWNTPLNERVCGDVTWNNRNRDGFLVVPFTFRYSALPSILVQGNVGVRGGGVHMWGGGDTNVGLCSLIM